MNHEEYPLNVATPRSFTYVTRDIPRVTAAQRERALKATHYNEFAFPAGMLTVDMLSDSGTTAMTDVQWSAMFLGDESYGRNKGYYVLLDALRDCFERGNDQKHVIDLVRTNCKDIDRMMDELYLCEYEGGLFNGGAAQMERPNAFIIQQGRAAESVLMEIVKKILTARHPAMVFTTPSKAISIPPRGNIKQMGSHPPATCTTRSCCMRSPRAALTRRTRSRATWTSRAGAADSGRGPRERAFGVHLHHQQPHLRSACLHGQHPGDQPRGT